MKKLRVTDLITNEEIENWNAGDCITIKAGTGTGKSYFIKNTLYDKAKKENAKILMLIHRINCIDQFIAEIIRDKKTDVIDIKTYQKLEHKELKKYKNDLSEYQYIVCDEFHYFMSDAAFNITTDLSLNLILSQSKAIKIFMSATGDYMKKYINNTKKKETIDYELPITYDFIKSLTFFNLDETLEKFIEEAIKKNHKAIFFIQSATEAYELYKKYKDYCLFNCGKSDKHYKYVNKDKISEMLTNERFEELILITTTCLDTGVNIIDVDLEHIVCDVKDIGVLIQCIGRKRIQKEDDKFYLYIKTINNKSLGGMETQLKNKIQMADYLRDHTVKEFVEKYKRKYDVNKIVYDDIVDEEDKSTKRINELMFFKVKTDLGDINFMKAYGEFGYCKYLADKFGFRNDDGNYNYRIIEEDYKTDDLNFYLNSIVGKKLYKDEQKELAEKVNIKRNGKLLKSYGSLNAYFLEDNIKFYIKCYTDNIKKLKDDSKNPHYRKVYWMIYKLSTEPIQKMGDKLYI